MKRLLFLNVSLIALAAQEGVPTFPGLISPTTALRLDVPTCVQSLETFGSSGHCTNLTQAFLMGAKPQ